MEIDNEVLSAVMLIERVGPKMRSTSREPIRRPALMQIKDQYLRVLGIISSKCSDMLLLTPIAESVKLIESILEDNSYIETDSDTKDILTDKYSTILQRVYLFAGKYYMDHEFEYNLSKDVLITNIVDSCVANGFYFGFDNEV